MVCRGLCGLASLKLITSSIRLALSDRVACETHFSTTLDANLCCDSDSTLPFTAVTIRNLSSGLPCSVQKTKKNGMSTKLIEVYCFSHTEDVLDNIVAVLILDESFRVVMQLVQYWRRLLGGAVFENALDDAASVRVRRK